SIIPCCPSLFCDDSDPTSSSTLSLHDALPIFFPTSLGGPNPDTTNWDGYGYRIRLDANGVAHLEEQDSGRDGPKRPKTWSSRCRSEEHTSELQSRSDLVCRLLLEKKKAKQQTI